MKRASVLLGCLGLCLVGIHSMSAQNLIQDKDTTKSEKIVEDEGPIMFKFEPGYLSSLEKRRGEMARARRILDTLDISENRRRKLLRDLYKNGISKRLSKALIVENKYEEIEQ